MPSKFSILTPSGFQKFDSIIRKINQSILIKTRSGNSIRTSLNHVFIVNGREIKASTLKPGDYITKNDRVVSASLYKTEYLYDPLNVQNGNTYIGNKIVHHNCAFLGSSLTLINGDTLSRLSAKDYIWTKNEFDAIEEPQPTHTYFLSVDTSEGVGGDYSTFHIIDVTKFPYLSVGKYRCNTISYLLFPNIIHQFAKRYNDAFVLIEINGIGNQVAHILFEDLEYENVLMVSQRSKDGQFLSMAAQANYGVKTTKQVKRIGCQALKTLMEEQKLLVFDEDTIKELSTFIEKKGSYSADEGYHDDLVMPLVTFAWASQDNMFKDIINVDTRRAIFESRMQEIENEMLPEGFYNDGTEEEETFSFF